MSSLTRGGKNAFRNLIRTGSLALIVGLSIGLALVMVLSLKAVQSKIDTVKSSIGNTITISPAGARGFEGGGEPLTETDLKTVTNLPHVTKTVKTMNDRLEPSTDTSLASAIDPGTLGQRQQRGLSSRNTNDAPPPDDRPDRQATQAGTRTFTIPVMVAGTNDVSSSTAISGNKLTVTSGKMIAAGKDTDTAIIGKALASKNKLKVGSTFTAYGSTITVVGIFDAGNQFANSEMMMPLTTVQRLSGRTGEVSSAVVTVDSIDNIDKVQKSASLKLGSKADIVTSQDTSKEALDPLTNIKSIATYGLIGSLAAGAVIIFLSMLMIVRERRREIGVLKAIGASNIKVVLQFVTESFVLTILGSIVGGVLGVILSNPILNTMVATSTSGTANAANGAGRFGPGFRMAGAGSIIRTATQGIHTAIGYDILIYGLLAAIVIAVLGSAIPAWFISRIRPAEVMRSE